MNHGMNTEMKNNIINTPPWSVAIHALIEFDTIERLCALGKSALDRELDELHAAMDADYKAFESKDEEGDYLSHINDEYIQVSEILPCLHWYAQFLIAYSFFEKSLNALSASFQQKNGLALSFKDMNGMGIDRAKTYLIKVCNITSPFMLPAWKKVKEFSEIRNAIAHRNGFIDYSPNDKSSLYSRLANAGLELKSETKDQDDAQIILTADFVLNSIEIFKSMIREIAGLGKDFITPKHGLPSGTVK